MSRTETADSSYMLRAEKLRKLSQGGADETKPTLSIFYIRGNFTLILLLVSIMLMMKEFFCPYETSY